MTNRLVLLAAYLLGACSFSNSVPEPDVFVGFAVTESTADEKDKMFPVVVELSAATSQDVVVQYQIQPGEGVDAGDFQLLSSEVVIPAGQLSAPLYFDIATDTMEEDDEHLDITLVEPMNAKIDLGKAHHDLKIRAKALPRVSFEEVTSTAQEPNDATFRAMLDEASSFEITATYTVTSANATAGADYILAAGTATFPAGERFAPVVLDVLEDALDEDNESVVVTITEATNAIVQTAAAIHTHTILDDIDLPPTVQFSAQTQTQAEAAGTVTIGVTLSAPSGRTISVPYSVAAGSTATGGGTDYTITAGPLTIAAGATTAVVNVTIINDTTDEPTENVVVDMGTATNATNTGTQQHVLQITDDDQICYGTAPYVVCLDAPPAGSLALPALIDTTNSTLCATTQPTGWTTAPQSQPAACFILRDTITVPTAVTVTGGRSLVLLAHTALTVSARLDASSIAGSVAPGSNPADCGGLMGNPGNSNNGGGGGAGGSFVNAGANGGAGDNGNTAAGMAAAASGIPTKLRGGCNGQKGGNGVGGPGGASGGFGRGGGAVYLVTAGTLKLDATGIVNASGGGGAGGGNASGGSGGGSGGMIRLHAATLMATTGATILANGGGGASGGDGGTGGTDGADPDAATPNTPAPGGTGGGGASGGAGRAGTTNPAKGDDANNNEGGGGGGGGGGLVQSNNLLTNVTVSAGVIQQ